MMNPELLETLREAQRFGFFGSRPIEEAVAHSHAFVAALAGLQPGSRIVDLGSGGGLPGLVVAEAFRDCSILLIDRRQKRTDQLARAVRRLGFDHVVVRCGDVADLVRDVRAGARMPAGEAIRSFDAVTARGFGPPATTLRFACELVSPGGRIVISEPPSGDRWPLELLAELGLSSHRQGAVRVFTRA